MSNHLLVFLKNPVKGKVKTRLAADMGDEKALDIYKWLVRHTLSVAKECKAIVHLFYNDVPESFFTEPAQHVYKQKGRDLGSRMVHAFELIQKENNSQKMIMIGSDCPDINSGVITDAFDKLQFAELVIGPAEDGGIYLIGMRGFDARIFNRVPWSTDRVFKKLIDNCQKLTQSYLLLEELTDIDRISDFRRYEEQYEQFKSC